MNAYIRLCGEKFTLKDETWAVIAHAIGGDYNTLCRGIHTHLDCDDAIADTRIVAIKQLISSTHIQLGGEQHTPDNETWGIIAVAVEDVDNKLRRAIRDYLDQERLTLGA